MADVLFSDYVPALVEVTILDGTEQIVIIKDGLDKRASVEHISGMPKQYVAYLNQVTTSAPVATVLKNTLGGTPVFARSGTGIYTMTLTGAFPSGKVFIPCGVNRPIIGFTGDCKIIQAYRSSDNVISFITWSGTTSSAALQDSVMSDLDIEIYVYP